jgi:Tfp pilus assembly protein PilE
MLRNNKGLTLMEILGAMTILGFVVILFISVSDYTVIRTYKNNTKYNALLLAENTLKEIIFEVNQSHSSGTPKEIGTYDKIPTTSMPFTIHTDETLIDVTDGYQTTTPINKATQVSVQAVVNLKDSGDGNIKPRLLTVTVSWGG